MVGKLSRGTAGLGAALALLLLSSAGQASAAGTGAKQPHMTPRQVVDTFDNLILAHKAGEAIDRFIAEDFVEHDPLVAVDGKTGLIRYMHEHGWDKPGVTESRDVIDRIISEGDWVVVHHHIYRHPGDQAEVFVDIFRLRHGKIQEHWDVMQKVPDHTDNKHTMY